MNEEEILLQYLTVKSAYACSAIPGTGKWTFLSKMSGIPEAWTLDEEQNPILFVRAEDRILSLLHAPDGKRAVVGVDCKGNEKQQLFLAGEGKLEPLMQSAEHFHYPGGWSPDGQLFSYSSNRRHPGYFDIFVISIATREVNTVFTHDGNCVPLGWADHDSLLIRIRETNLDSTIYHINIRTGQQVRIGPAGTLAKYEAVRMADGGKKGYALTDLGEETLYLCEYSTDSPERLTKLLHFPRWDIEEIALSPQEDILAFTVNEGGVSRLGFYHIATAEHEMTAGIPAGVIDSLSWLSGEALLFSLKSPVMPGDIWEYSRSSRAARRLTFISRADSISGRWAEPEICTYRSFDGLEVPYFFYNQTAEQGKPAVIYVHGGPEGQTKAEYHPVMQYLVRQGFAVAAPNVRGSSGYGRTYIRLDDARKRMDSVRDLAWLVKDLTENRGVAPGKIGIMGRSYGGFMVLAAVTHYPDLWAAGVDIVGISNLKTMLKNTGEWRRRLRECEYGSLAEHSDFFDEIAPLHHSDKIKAPLLVFHGRNDTRVPVSEAEQLVGDMQARQQEVELIVFEDEGHQTEKLENHITMHRKTVEFFRKHLN
ncbi:S9 family peptidase [Paenibacillus terreus]|uniref:S9 family peptidase n=1 Tax=Paenibacillus terreus TaxID=1387834 RepID=A0ABV5B0W6_9BACL